MAPWARRWPVGDGQVHGSVRQLGEAAHASREVGAPEGPEVPALDPHIFPSGVGAPYCIFLLKPPLIPAGKPPLILVVKAPANPAQNRHSPYTKNEP